MKSVLFTHSWLCIYAILAHSWLCMNTQLALNGLNNPKLPWEPSGVGFYLHVRLLRSVSQKFACNRTVPFKQICLRNCARVLYTQIPLGCHFFTLQHINGHHCPGSQIANTVSILPRWSVVILRTD